MKRLLLILATLALATSAMAMIGQTAEGVIQDARREKAVRIETVQFRGRSMLQVTYHDSFIHHLFGTNGREIALYYYAGGGFTATEVDKLQRKYHTAWHGTGIRNGVFTWESASGLQMMASRQQSHDYLTIFDMSRMQEILSGSATADAPAVSTAAQVSPTPFTMGSAPSEVAAVMGTPTSVYDFGGGQLWYYGTSSVTFNNGAVSGWSNIAGNLQVVYPGAAPAYAQPNRNQTPALYTQPGQYTQPNPSPTPTLHTGPAVAENGSYYGQPNKSGVPKTVPVRGYYRKDGTYVRPHYRSRPRR
jgi:hypothetical protein